MTAHHLVLIRHAKTAAGPVDVSRSLTARGHRDARASGSWLAGLGLRIDRVVVSPARRAAETWDEIVTCLDGSGSAVTDDRIYQNTVEALLEVVHETPDDAETLAIVGHSPGLPQLADVIDDGLGDPDSRRQLGAGYPTGGIAVFSVGSWSELDEHTARLRSFSAPRHPH